MGLGASKIPTSNELLYLIVKVIAVLRVMAVILVESIVFSPSGASEGGRECSAHQHVKRTGQCHLCPKGGDVLHVVEQSPVSGWGLEEVFSSVEDGVEIGPLKLRESEEPYVVMLLG
ncbi:hypothetical protein BHM03_00037526 [Ensete ventricosum]|nr:hypothetical protein BHM03_00037526 [Ensete ventricosum]